jgi:hypothetical protein
MRVLRRCFCGLACRDMFATQAWPWLGLNWQRPGPGCFSCRTFQTLNNSAQTRRSCCIGCCFGQHTTIVLREASGSMAR